MNLMIKIEDPSESSSGAKCDLESESFDAQSSLVTDSGQVSIPVPDAHTFNNIDEYFSKSFGKINSLKHLTSNSSSKSVPIIERTLKIVGCLPRHPKRELQTVLTKMKSSTKGPNSLLLKCLNKRIKILIRRRKSVKLYSERFGWVSGLLIAFDKHFNLCLTDVDEKYQRLDQNNQTINVCNYFKQLFVRGDNVVIIAFV